MMNRAYRSGASIKELQEEEVEEAGRIPEFYGRGEGRKHYFEVLVVDDSVVERGNQQSVRDAFATLRRPDDKFVYEPVFVPSFEDAVAAILCNDDLQSVVIYDYFPFGSDFDIPHLRNILAQMVEHSEDTLDDEAYATTLATVIKRIRPELDIFLMTDRKVEELASDPDTDVVRRIFYDVEELNELHLSIMGGVETRYSTPHFSNLQHFARRPIGTFHALPIARGKSIFKSNWIQDMGRFYGTNLFLAETSTTAGGLDSLLEPKGNIKEAHEKAARCFGSNHTWFVTNGTSTANKIIVQALCKPGDIVIVDRNCHKSHHYGFILGGAQPYYVDAYPLVQYSMYGAVPTRTIKEALLDLQAEGKLDKARMVLMTNVTFDGQIYNVQQVMEECLAIKPDLVFLWDEAWFAFARFSPLYRPRTAMASAEALHERFATPEYRAEYEAFKKSIGEIDIKNKKVLDTHLLPDPDKVRIRAYSTHSTHKSLSALRQGSMIHEHDEDFEADVHEAFDEAFMAHTSTLPNAQIIASLDLARRQAELEGYGLVREQIELSLEMRNQINHHPLISKYFRMLTPEELVPAEYRQSGIKNYYSPDVSWEDVVDAWRTDEFVLDPTRLTLVCGTAGLDGTAFKNELMDHFDIQLNKTSRNSVLFQSNINNTRSSVSYVIKILARIAKDLDKKLEGRRSTERAGFEARVKSLMTDVPDLPNFSYFHPYFRDDPNSKTREGHMREGFYTAYTADNCEHVKLFSKEVDERLKKGPDIVSANLVIPYPPGFPIMVPGQVVTKEIIDFMRKLDVKEIHGYNADAGLKPIKPSFLAKRRKKAA